MLKQVCATYLHVYLVIFLSIVSFLMKDLKARKLEVCSGSSHTGMRWEKIGGEENLFVFFFLINIYILSCSTKTGLLRIV